MSTGNHFDSWRRIIRLQDRYPLFSDNPPSPGEVGVGINVPYSYSYQISESAVRWDQRVFVLEVSRKFNRLQMSLQRQHLLLSNLILRAWVFLRSGFEPATSSSANQRSPGWANQTAEVNKNLAHCYLIMEILTYPVRVINKHFGQKSTANFAICLLLFSIWFPPIPES